MTKNPNMRLGSQALGGESAILRHPYFKQMDWDLLNQRQVEPPFRPRIVSDGGAPPSAKCFPHLDSCGGKDIDAQGAWP